MVAEYAGSDCWPWQQFGPMSEVWHNTSVLRIYVPCKNVYVGTNSKYDWVTEV